MRFAFVPGIPRRFFAGLCFVEPLQAQAGTEAVGTPAMFGVIRKHARIGFRKTGAAAGAGPFHRKMLRRKALKRL